MSNKEIDIHKEISIVDLLDSALTEDYKKQYGGTRVYNPLRPSASGKCARALAFEFKEYVNKESATLEDKDPATIRLLNVGRYIENSLVSQLRQMKSHFDIQVKYVDQMVTVATLKDGTLIEGEIDFALEGNGFKILGDAKSSKDKFSSSYQSQWDETLKKWSKMKEVTKLSDTCFYVEDAYSFCKALKDDFKTDNVMQVNMYLGSDFFQERKYEHGALYYYLKNDSRVYELRFKYSPKLRDFVISKYQAAYDSKDPMQVERTFDIGSIRCAFCPFKDKCWSNQDPLYEYFQTLPKKRWAKKLEKLKDCDEIEKLFDEYEKMLTSAQNIDTIEEAIAKKLYEQKADKVQRSNGDVWEVKILKSPREHLVLRRSKN